MEAINSRTCVSISKYERGEEVLSLHFQTAFRSVRVVTTFKPLVFSATGGMAPAATIAYKKLAFLLADKRKQEYNKTISLSWLQCFIGFSAVRIAVMCLRGARSSYHHPASKARTL